MMDFRWFNPMDPRWPGREFDYMAADADVDQYFSGEGQSPLIPKPSPYDRRRGNSFFGNLLMRLAAGRGFGRGNTGQSSLIPKPLGGVPSNESIGIPPFSREIVNPYLGGGATSATGTAYKPPTTTNLNINELMPPPIMDWPPNIDPEIASRTRFFGGGGFGQTNNLNRGMQQQRGGRDSLYRLLQLAMM